MVIVVPLICRHPMMDVTPAAATWDDNNYNDKLSRRVMPLWNDSTILIRKMVSEKRRVDVSCWDRGWCCHYRESLWQWRRRVTTNRIATQMITPHSIRIDYRYGPPCYFYSFQPDNVGGGTTFVVGKEMG